MSDIIRGLKRGLWDNIHAKRERIAGGSGEKMRKPGDSGAPTDEAIRQSKGKRPERGDYPDKKTR
jgi:hypothetical protein